MLTTPKQIKQSFFRAALQAGAARQLAEMKKNLHFKKKTDRGHGFLIGSKPLLHSRRKESKGLGLSAVSEVIKEKYGAIVSRRQRRAYKSTQALVSSNDWGQFDVRCEMPYTAHYNGDGPVKVPHNISPSKYGRRGKRS